MAKGDRESVGRTPPLETPSVVSTRPIFEGQIITVRVDEVLLSNGITATREVVEHAGAVVVVAIDDDQHVYLVEQYRHPIGRCLLELPAGTLEAGEKPLEAAKRELREEVGLQAKEWTHLGGIFSTPGFCSEMLDVYLAQGLTHTDCDPDDDEELSILRIPLAELRQGTLVLQDAKSLAALQLLEKVDLPSGNQS